VPPLIGEQKRVLDPRRGPFFQRGEAQLYLALRNGIPVGRISAHIDDRHDAIHDDRKGFFGFFECEHDQEAATALFQAAENWLSERGRQTVEGPYSFTIHDELGVLIDGFDSMPYVMNTHNRPYYRELLEGGGYSKAIDWHAFRTDRRMISEGWPSGLTTLRDRILAREGFELRSIDPERFDENAQAVKNIFNSAWAESWDHVPIGDEEFLHIARGLKRLIVPELSFFAVDDGEPVGFVVSVRDPNPALRRARGRLFPWGWFHLWRALRRPGRFRVMLLGVLEPFRGRGYEIALYTTVALTGMELGFLESEMSIVAENNAPMLKALSRIPTDRYRIYRVFTKRLPDSSHAVGSVIG
jgi:ribosomal protein S18 acetylase RimI-like enzyme